MADARLLNLRIRNQRFSLEFLPEYIEYGIYGIHSNFNRYHYIGVPETKLNLWKVPDRNQATQSRQYSRMSLRSTNANGAHSALFLGATRWICIYLKM